MSCAGEGVNITYRQVTGGPSSHNVLQSTQSQQSRCHFCSSALRRRQPQAEHSLSTLCTTSILAGTNSRVKPAAAEQDGLVRISLCHLEQDLLPWWQHPLFGLCLEVGPVLGTACFQRGLHLPFCWNLPRVLQHDEHDLQQAQCR